MEINGNNLEPEFEALLKSQVQSATSVAACYQFDPDTANAYLEQALSQRALTTYEEHLTSCASCRRHIIELSRLLPPPSIAAEPVVIRTSFQARLSEWFSGWRLGALAGLGAVAATVLLIAVVVNRSRLDSASPMVAARQSETQVTPLPEPSARPRSEEEIKRESQAVPSASPSANVPLMDRQDAAKTVPAAPPTSTLPSRVVGGDSRAVVPPPPPPAPTPAPSKTEAERKEVAVNQPGAVSGSASSNQIQNMRAQTPSGPEVNQIQAERALARAKKDSEPIAADAAAPASAKPAPKSPEKPPEKVVEKRSREMEEDANKQQPKARAMKLPSVVMAPVSRSRVVSGKTFRQESGLWVDEAYDAGKDLPVVRLTRDSENYKQTLKDLPGLKPYFDLKPVIVVWQGKVYRVEK